MDAEMRELQQRMWDVVEAHHRFYGTDPTELWLSFDPFLAYRDWYGMNEGKYRPPEAWNEVRFCGIRVTHHEDAARYGSGIMVSPADIVAAVAR